MQRPKILIVDDDPHLVEALGLWLGKHDYEILTAVNGDQALGILRSGTAVDLVLSDFMMPELNGLELLRMAKSSPELFSVKIVLMSNNADPEFRKRAADLGAVDFLLKTTGAKTITERIVGILSSGTPPATHREPALNAQSMSQALVELLEAVSACDGLPASTRAALRSAQILAGQLSEQIGPKAVQNLSNHQ